MSIRILLALLLTAILAACSGATSELDPDFVQPTGEPGAPVIIPGGLRILFNAPSLDAGAFSPDQGVEVRAVATSAGNATIPGVRVAFASDSGLVFVGETLTDESGSAVAVLTTGGDPSARMINVTATVPGSRVTATAQIPVVPPENSQSRIAAVNLIATAGTLAADAVTASDGLQLTAIVTDARGNLLPSAPVSFSLQTPNAALQVIDDETQADGTARAILTTGGNSSQRTVTILATAGSVTRSLAVTVGPVVNPANVVDAIILTSDKPALEANDTTFASGAVITAVAVNAQGQIIVGAPMALTVAGGAAIQAAATQTDSSGQVVAALSNGGNGSPRTLTVTALSGAATSTLQIPVAAAPQINIASINIDLDRPSLAPGDSTPDRALTLSAIPVDPQGRALVDVVVSFSIESGGGALLPTNNGLTDSSGIARARLTTGGSSTPRNIVVVASVGNVVATRTIEVVAAASPLDRVAAVQLAASAVSLEPTASSLAAGVTITGTAVDAGGRTIEGVPVDYAVTSGNGTLTITKPGTDAAGPALAILTTGGNPTPRNITVTGTSAGRTSTITIAVRDPNADRPPPASVLLRSSRPELFIDENSFEEGLSITAQVLDAGGVAVENAAVTFTLVSGGGALSAGTVSSDQSGTSTVLLHSGGGAARDIVLRASVSGSVNTTLTIPVKARQDQGQPPASVLLSSSRPQLFTDEVTFATGVVLTAQVLDAAGVAVANSDVSFALVSGGGALSTGTVRSDQAGTATVQLHSGGGQPRDIVVQATVAGTIIANLTVPVQLRQNQGSVVSRLVISSPSTVLAPNQSTAQTGLPITVTALDAGSAPVADAPVTFSIVTGEGVITPAGSQTDQQGVITASLSTGGNSSPRTITVRVASGAATQTASYTVEAVQLNLTLLASSPTLPSAAQAATDGVVVTAVVTNQSNVRQSGVPVTFTASSGSILTTDGVTGDNGEATAILTTNGDPSHRTITVTASRQSNAVTLDIPVVGTTLSSESPGNAGVGEPFTISLLLTDSNQTPLINRQVTLESALGNIVAPASAFTNSGGRAFFQVTPNIGGSEVLTGRALGITLQMPVAIQAFALQFIAPDEDQEVPLGQAANVSVRLTQNAQPASGRAVALTASRGTLAASTITTGPDGTATTTVSSQGAGATGGSSLTASVAGLVATRSIEFVSLDAASLLLRADRSSVQVGQETPITAVVRDALGNPVKNKTVTFQLQDPTLGSLSRLTVVTNALGQALVTYTAGQTSSAPNAVTVTATIPEAPPQSILFTVGGQALRITLGTSNVIGEDPSGTVYELPYAAIVTDASGNPVPNVSVSFRVDSVSYQKGRYVEVDDGEGGTTLRPAYRAEPQDGFFGCLNEDVNRNGILEMGEDFNGNGRLDPGNAASVQPTISTDPNGQANVTVRYAQDFANWVRVTLSATAAVGGTEATESRTFTLPIARDDLEDPPGFVSPFGESNACADPA